MRDIQFFDHSANAYLKPTAEYPPKPQLHEPSERCPAAYSMHWYCKYISVDHAFQEFPHQYEGQTRGEHLTAARAEGWMLHSDQTATCPKCAKALGIGKFRSSQPPHIEG